MKSIKYLEATKIVDYEDFDEVEYVDMSDATQACKIAYNEGLADCMDIVAKYPELVEKIKNLKA